MFFKFPFSAAPLTFIYSLFPHKFVHSNLLIKTQPNGEQKFILMQTVQCIALFVFDEIEVIALFI